MHKQVDQETSYVLKATKSGHMTCQVTVGEQNLLLHSAYDPVKEAQQFVAPHIDKIQGKDKIIVYGLGCGHHIAELIKVTRESHIKIEVWEFNTGLYELVKAENIIENLLLDSRVSIYVSHDKKKIIERTAHFNPESDYIIMHQASVKVIPTWLKDIKEIFEIFQLNVSNMVSTKEKLNKHFTLNVETAKIDRNNVLFGLLSNVPMVLVAAGPSLQKNIAFLQKYHTHIFIGAVGTALQPLLSHEIIPDFFMLTDSAEIMSSQFANVSESMQKKIPLFYLSTVMPSVVSKYAGSKIMLLQQGMEQAENLAKELNIVAVQTGGSVATTLLDWMVQLGAKQICFVGQDLAWPNNQTHVSSANSYKQLAEDSLQSLREIDDYFQQGKVRTPANLYAYKKWIEEYIGEHLDIEFFNATQGGAYIEGCRHVDFECFMKSICFDGDMQLYKEKFLQAINRITRD